MMDLVLEGWVSSLIEVSKLRYVLGAGERWQPGRKLKLLFCGYNGARNTGSDVRVDGMIRQIRHVLGPHQVEISVLTQDFELTKGYFGDAKQVRLPDIFPPFLYREVPKYDGVVTCEGSMFKSKFADALTVMMIGSLGTASAYNKLAVGYGAEAGHMNTVPRWMTSRYCGESLVITRNEESRKLLTDLGVPSEMGTDTAWTFDPHPPEYGRAQLTKAGWKGEPVLVICPINPFWWPVKASLFKALARPLGAYKRSHYRSIYFHNSGPRVDAAYDRYLAAIANAVDAFRKRTRVFPVLVAMEQLDLRACRRISDKLGGLPVFASSDYDMYQLVSIACCGHMMVSSRYHGIVTTMPALVASAGITMDERIRNLMRQRGQQHLLMEVDDPDLEAKLDLTLDTLHRDAEQIRDGIGRTVVAHLKTMARMGVYFEDNVRRLYPDFPARTGIHSWDEYLPPLSEDLRRLVETYGP
ncbi:MAG: polysaccharide pyruvyl transferase family protein [Planctomycetota bacterium]|jgi:polysaccharide pyruvyl transferase WcaK-like protein